MFKLYVIQCLKVEGTGNDMDAIQKQHSITKKTIVLKTFLIKRSKTTNFSQNRLFKQNIMGFCHRKALQKALVVKFMLFILAYSTMIKGERSMQLK